MSIRKGAAANDPPEVTAKLGKTINRLRRAYNYSLGDLSEQSGVAKSIISQIEKNETNPTLGTIYKLARALNAPIEEILSGEDAPALIEKLGPSGTPLLVSDDGRCRLRIVGWIKTVELVQWYYFEAEPGGVLESEPHPAGSVENLTLLSGSVGIVSGTSNSSFRPARRPVMQAIVRTVSSIRGTLWRRRSWSICLVRSPQQVNRSNAARPDARPSILNVRPAVPVHSE